MRALDGALDELHRHFHADARPARDVAVVNAIVVGIFQKITCLALRPIELREIQCAGYVPAPRSSRCWQSGDLVPAR
jgi:hypothetical protein